MTSSTEEFATNLSYFVSLLGELGLSKSVSRRATQYGLGLFADEDIALGSLILAENPIAFVYDSELLSNSWSKDDGSDSWGLSLAVCRSGVLSETLNLHPRDPVRGLQCPTLPESLRASFNMSDEELALLLTRVSLNSFGTGSFPEFLNTKISDSGTGLYPTAALLDHSCVPNVFRYSLDKTLVMRAARDIQKNEQLFISYIPNESLNEVKEVRAGIIRHRDFECSCAGCRENHAKFSRPSAQRETLNFATLAQLNQLTAKERFENISEYLDIKIPCDSEKVVDTLISNNPLALGDIMTLLVSRAVNSCDLEISCWELALRFAKQILPPYDFTIAVLIFHTCRVSGHPMTQVEEFCQKYLNLDAGDVAKLFQFELALSEIH